MTSPVGRLLVPLLLLELMVDAGTREYGESEDVRKQCKQWMAPDEREECQQCLTQHSADANPAELLRKADLILRKTSDSAICELSASSLQGVCKLWAEQCALVRVPPMPCLRHLRAPANRLADLRSLEDLPSLRSADVSANIQLGRHLGEGSGGGPFFKAPELRSLNMTACAVRNLRSSAFEGLPKLEVLFLRANYLQTLTLEVFQSLTLLRVLDVSDNKLLHVSVNLHLRCLLAVNVSVFDDAGPALRNLSSPSLALALKPSTCCACRLHDDLSGIRQESITNDLAEVAKPVETTHVDRCRSADDYEIRTVADWKNRCIECFPNGYLADTHPITTIVHHPVSDSPTFPIQITSTPSRITTERNSKVLPVNSVTELVRAQATPNTAAANLAVVVVSSVLSMLLVAQSVFVVFLLLRRRQRLPRETAKEVPPTWPVTDLDDDLVYSSLNPVYETIQE